MKSKNLHLGIADQISYKNFNFGPKQIPYKWIQIHKKNTYEEEDEISTRTWKCAMKSRETASLTEESILELM